MVFSLPDVYQVHSSRIPLETHSDRYGLAQIIRESPGKIYNYRV